MSKHGEVTVKGKTHHAWRGVDGSTYYVSESRIGRNYGSEQTKIAGPAVKRTYREVESDSMMVAIADVAAEIFAPNEPRSPEESDQYWVQSVLWSSDLPGLDWGDRL